MEQATTDKKLFDPEEMTVERWTNLFKAAGITKEIAERSNGWDDHAETKIIVAWLQGPAVIPPSGTDYVVVIPQQFEGPLWTDDDWKKIIEGLPENPEPVTGYDNAR